jgi:hypothetical protein
LAGAVCRCHDPMPPRRLRCLGRHCKQRQQGFWLTLRLVTCRGPLARGQLPADWRFGGPFQPGAWPAGQPRGLAQPLLRQTAAAPTVLWRPSAAWRPSCLAAMLLAAHGAWLWRGSGEKGTAAATSVAKLWFTGSSTA